MDERTTDTLLTPALTRGHYRWLALGFLALAVYGSLVPFHYCWAPFDAAWTRYWQVMRFPLRIHSISDWAANVLLFLPLGYCLTAGFGADRRRAAGVLAALVVVPACTLLSAALEFAQLYFPPRVTSPNDVAAETLGAALGAGIWIACGQPLTAFGRRRWVELSAYGWAARALPAYLAFLAVIHVMPLDLTISPVELFHKYEEGRVVLVPYRNLVANPPEEVRKHLWLLGYFFPLGWLLARIPSPTWQTWKSWRHVAGAGLAAAALMELLQLLVFPRVTDVSDILTGALGVSVGWAAALAGGRLFPVDEPERMATDGRRSPSSRFVMLTSILFIWFMIAAYVRWAPFNFSADRNNPGEHLRGVALIPFTDYTADSGYGAFERLLHKILLFLPLGAMLAVPAAARRPGFAGVVALAAFVLATALEIGRCFLPMHPPSLTDALVEVTGAVTGFALFRRLRTLRQTTMTPGWRTP